MLYLLGQEFSWFTFIMQLAVLALIAFVVFPARGFAQAFVAYKLGDPTGKYAGRMTMNPLAHIDKFGIVVLFLCGLGFVKPVPINAHNFKNPRRDLILTALAGPVMGLLMGFLGVAVYRIAALFVTEYVTLYKLFTILITLFARLNIQLAILTLLPIPFFDGYQILAMFLPGRWVYWVESNSMMVSIFVLILIVSGLLNVPLNFLTNLVVNGMLFLVGA